MTKQFKAVILLITLFVATGVTGCAEQRPRRVIASSGVIEVRQGDSLQSALDSAQPGDTIVLQAGVNFTGPFKLHAKTGEQYITIKSGAIESLPKEGTRVSPGDAPLMPKILAPGDGESALKTEPGAHHYRFIGIEFKPRDSNSFSYGLISLGSDSVRSASEQPHHLTFDRCYIHSEGPSRRGIALNSGETVITNSYIAGFKEQKADSQAICGWNGPGPYHIINNYLEAAGENILFGGADPSVQNLIPSDIEIRRNYLSKPLAWRGANWIVKNLLELKSARRVVIEGNLIENSWAATQGGTAVLFTPRNQDGNAPWTAVSDVDFRSNIIRHAVTAISILGTDYIHPSAPTHSIHITNNLVYDIDGPTWGNHNGGLFITISGAGAQQIEVAHNTAVHTGAGISFEDDSSVTDLAITDNVMRFHIIGSGMAGNEAVQRFARGRVTVRNNAIVLSEKREYWMSNYPVQNLYPESYQNVGFVNGEGGDFSLQNASPLKHRASDKSDIGVDFAALKSAGAFQDFVTAR